jgi:hypothetical protein
MTDKTSNPPLFDGAWEKATGTRWATDITLRDLFAGMVLCGMAGREKGYSAGTTAATAYLYADAMLAEREKK